MRAAILGLACCFVGCSGAGAATLDELVTQFRRSAPSAQADQLASAIQASPRLKLQLQALAQSGRLEAFELVTSRDVRLANTPFGARAQNRRVFFTAEFLEAQKPQRLLHTTSLPPPNNLVFSLSHLARHLERPFEASPSLTKDQFLALKLGDEADAYIAGWNALLASLPGVSSVPRDGEAMLNLRYRAVFLKAMDKPPELFAPGGEIAATRANRERIAAALMETNIPDFE